MKAITRIITIVFDAAVVTTSIVTIVFGKVAVTTSIYTIGFECVACITRNGIGDPYKQNILKDDSGHLKQPVL